MILNVTEEQKKLIESKGYMVVEFKLWYRKLVEMLIDYVRRWIDTWKAIVLFLQEKIAKAVDTLVCILRTIIGGIQAVCGAIRAFEQQRTYRV